MYDMFNKSSCISRFCLRKVQTKQALSGMHKHGAIKHPIPEILDNQHNKTENAPLSLQHCCYYRQTYLDMNKKRTIWQNNNEQLIHLSSEVNTKASLYFQQFLEIISVLAKGDTF